MRSRIRCFLLEDLRRSRYRLRRYVESDKAKCQMPGGYHDASSGVVAETDDFPDKSYHGTNPPPTPPHDDPRWPMACACGYAFQEQDKWQVFCDGLYRRVDTGEIMTWRDAPAGAVRDAKWWKEGAWMVRLPGQGSVDWMTHGKANNCNCPSASNHTCWTTSGAAPDFTVSPSIAYPGWHGFLRAGWLEEC